MNGKLLAAAAVMLAIAAGPTAYLIAEETGNGTNAASSTAAKATLIDIPINGTIYPPDIIAPQFAWRDDTPAVTVWRIEIVFASHARAIKTWSNGEKMQLAPVDSTLEGYVPPTLTPQQAAAHTWRPEDKTWEEIKQHSVGQPATVIISGYASEKDHEPALQVPGDLSNLEGPGSHAHFLSRRSPDSALRRDRRSAASSSPCLIPFSPKSSGKLRYINEKQSRVVMTGLPTCGNCHSFSRDGKTMGIDVDGPANDKGLYALIPVKKISTISNDYLVHWSAFSEEHAQKRFGFMSQLSPDGNYVVNSIDVPHAHGVRVLDRLYNGFYDNYGFGQVFYPTRGVLAWYSKQSGKLQPLPGADDPNFVQTSAFWSPDGKWLVYSRAAARDPYPPGYKRSMYANDPNETQIQYDLYRIPFNDGKGGTAGANRRRVRERHEQQLPQGLA